MAAPVYSHPVRPTSVRVPSTEHSRDTSQPLRTHPTIQSSTTRQLEVSLAPTWVAMPISGQPGSYRWIAANTSPLSAYSVPGTLNECYPTAPSAASTSVPTNDRYYSSIQPNNPRFMATKPGSYMYVSSTLAALVLMSASNSNGGLGTCLDQPTFHSPIRNSRQQQQEEVVHTYAGQKNDEQWMLNDRNERYRYRAPSRFCITSY